MIKRLHQCRAQTALELAVFGAIFIFVIGVIIRQSLSYNLSQKQSLETQRLAMRLSFQHSQGLRGGTDPRHPRDGNASHNTASVLVLDDRLVPDSNKFGTLDRSPVVANITASHSRNLFLTIDHGEDYNLPVTDMFINGIHFEFTTAGFNLIHENLINGRNSMSDEEISNVRIAIEGLGIRPNLPPGKEGQIIQKAFDKYTRGDVMARRASYLALGKSVQEILVLLGLVILDPSKGDLDFTIKTQDIVSGAKKQAGFDSHMDMATTGELNIVENGQTTTSTQYTTQDDTIVRRIQLSNNTGRYCSGGSPTTPKVGGGAWGITNHVQECCSGSGCCDSYNVTCMDTTNKIIFVRKTLTHTADHTY
jgi:hypothetical protein